MVSPWTKWPPFWQTTFSDAFSWMKMIEFQYKFHWFFFPMSLINNKPKLVQVMVWHQTGNKPLPEPMLTQVINTYMWHQGKMNHQVIVVWWGHIVPQNLVNIFKVMTCCLTAPSQYLKQCWNHQWGLRAFTLGFENYQFKITTTSPRGQWVKGCHQLWYGGHNYCWG